MINKLIDRIQKTHAPVVAGLDPMLSYVPEHVQKRAYAEYGETLRGAAEAIWQFNREIVDHICDLIPAVKPQRKGRISWRKKRKLPDRKIPWTRPCT